MRPVCVIRIDPARRTIAALKLRAANDATPQIRRYVRANNVGSRQIMLVDGAPLMSMSGMDADEAVPRWRLPGTEDTAGIGLLTGRNPDSGRLIDVPVSIAWVQQRIQWLDGEDAEGREERAREMLPALNEDIVVALKRAVPVPSGEIWLTAADAAKVGDAMQTLGLGTERSRGQMCTKLGETMHDLLVFGTSLAAEATGQ